MTDEQLKKIESRARAFFRQGPFHHEMDDLVQEVLMTYIVNPKNQQKVSHACIDVTRRVMGDYRHQKQGKWHARPLSLDEIPSIEEGLWPTIEAQLDAITLFEKVSFTKGLRAMAYLHFFEGYSYQDIARHLGCSLSHISRVFKRIGIAMKESGA